MKNVIVILALVGMAGCSSMPWDSSSGGMGTSGMGAGTSGTTFVNPSTDPLSNEVFHGSTNPYSL